jgi:hypothetical protein
MLTLKLLDRFLLDTTEGACFSVQACKDAISVLYSARGADYTFVVRAFLDNVLVLLYSATLATGFMLGLRSVRMARLLLPMALLSVACLAALDFTENIYEMSWTEMDPGLAGALQLAPITAAKFALAALALVFVVPLELTRVRRIFIERWR